MNSSLIAQWQRMLDTVSDRVNASDCDDDDLEDIREAITALDRDLQQAYLDALRKENR